MGRVEMNCAGAKRLISMLIDGEISESQRRLLDFHLLGCRSCRKALRMSRDISRLTHDLPVPAPPADLEARVRDLLGNAPASETGGRGRLRSFLLAAPAVAALLLFALIPSRITTEPESIMDGPAHVTGISTAKADMLDSFNKSRTRTAPLYAYSRQASLISF